MKNKEAEVRNLIGKLETLVCSFSSVEDYEKSRLEDLLKEQEQNEELRHASISLAECHVIDCIERNELINTTAIAKKLNMTKGGISKITAKLVKKQMIELQRLANNQKETYYTLTPLGRKAFQVHEMLHEQAQRQFTVLFNTYSQEELCFAGRFLDDLIAAVQSKTIEKNSNPE